MWLAFSAGHVCCCPLMGFSCWNSGLVEGALSGLECDRNAFGLNCAHTSEQCTLQ